MHRLRVASAKFRYDVVVGCGAWRELEPYPKEKHSSIFVVTERPLWKRWGKTFLRDSGLKKPHALFVEPGETSKSLKTVESVASRLLDLGADRRSLLVAFGGGVVGDLAGFIASTYMRGIDLVHVPTTVVAQVDSAIGGKTGVNVGAMKNLVGTFYPPRMVLADPEVLTSLSDRAFRSGLYEVVKHAMLVGGGLFTRLETSDDWLKARPAKRLEPVLAQAARVKVDIVSRDEREARLRLSLNLGHTFGHALEEATGYQRFLHGEAVACGLLAVVRLAERLSILGRRDAERIRRLLGRVGPLPPIGDISPDKILRLLPRDKKAVGGRIQWVVPERIGSVRIVTDVRRPVAAAALRDIQKTSQ